MDSIIVDNQYFPPLFHAFPSSLYILSL